MIGPGQRLLLASGNAGKLTELRALCSGLPVRVLSPDDVPFRLPHVEEDRATFEGNAVQKAVATSQAAAGSGDPDLWVLADDSGLVVDALDGEPGVRSARFAGGEGTAEMRDHRNIALLLERMQGVPDEQRTARFVCALALARAGEVVLTCDGEVEGRILTVPVGEGGFGYDPLFYHPESDATFASLSAAEKDRVSHRGRAIARLRRALEKIFL